MPVTKKKGAIFAIYADSPVASTTAAPSGPSASPTKKGIAAVPLGGASSAPKTSSARPRKALGVVQARASAGGLSPFAIDGKSGAVQSGEGKDGVKGKGKGTSRVLCDASQGEGVGAGAGAGAGAGTGIQGARPSVNPKSSRPITLGAMPRSISGKRLRVPSVPPSPTNAIAPATSNPAASTSVLSSRETAKKSRTSSSRLDRPLAPSDVDKENAQPIVSAADSPASRTRSKTAAKGGATETRRTQVGVLMDASEAYGALGEEPVDFKTQGC